MQKLILTYSVGDGYTYSCDKVLAFEYVDKDTFVFDILEKFKDYEWKTYGKDTYSSSYHEEVEVFPDVTMTKHDIEHIEHNVFTLDEWFEQNKVTLL